MVTQSSTNFPFFVDVQSKMKDVLVLFHRFLGELQISLQRKQMVEAAQGFGAVFV